MSSKKPETKAEPDTASQATKGAGPALAKHSKDAKLPTPGKDAKGDVKKQ